MKIILENLGKRFNRQWIFRGINHEFVSGERYVILGSNGSGKSTLLQVISGYRLGSEGSVSYFQSDRKVDPDNYYKFISIASPYLSLIEEYTADELLKFHFGLRKMTQGLSIKDFFDILKLADIKNKPVRQYSSGMKQRLRLALAFLTHSEVLMLDEPCSNLDAKGVEWYQELLREFSGQRLVIICSNHQHNEFEPCGNIIEMGFYKTSFAGRNA